MLLPEGHVHMCYQLEMVIVIGQMLLVSARGPQKPARTISTSSMHMTIVTGPLARTSSRVVGSLGADRGWSRVDRVDMCLGLFLDLVAVVSMVRMPAT